MTAPGTGAVPDQLTDHPPAQGPPLPWAAGREEIGRAPRRHDPGWRGFASDNYAGAHPEVLAALAAANGGHQSAYGGDVYTAHLTELFREQFGPRAEVYPVLTGTGANVVALQAVTGRWGAVICTDQAHIHTDECGAPERIGGLKLLPVPAEHAKLTCELIDREAWGQEDEHRAMPQAVSLTQTTELGTCYTPEEIRALSEHAHRHGLAVHVDGARIANAAARLGVPLREFTTDAGVDVLSFGGTKNGMVFGEAVVVLRPDAVRGMRHLRKLTTQLPSKMRFVSAQFEALLTDELWLRAARRANAMARRLAEGARRMPGVTVVHPVESNAVFAALPYRAAQRLRRRYAFYFWDEPASVVRWMCSFDTTEEDVDTFLAALAEEVERPAGPAAQR